jgi:hypothetical protein
MSSFQHGVERGRRTSEVHAEETHVVLQWVGFNEDDFPTTGDGY